MPMQPKYILSTIPHGEHRYPTVGDWRPGKTAGDPDDIVVSEMDNADYEFLVLIHELIEFYLCKKRGITDADVTAFDVQFEEKRSAGQTLPGDEAGDHVDAPYKKEHFFATNIERQIAHELGVDWNEYDNAIENL